MQCVIPEISYHNRDPVLSLDFQPRKPLPGDPLRLATAGSDSHVVIFAVRFVKSDENDDGSATIGQGDSGSKVELDCLCDLTRHQKSVNIVRWSPDGTTLATGSYKSSLFQLCQKFLFYSVIDMTHAHNFSFYVLCIYSQKQEQIFNIRI